MAIINQVVSGGGTTPTGTIQITTNGTHDVTNYATADVQVPTTAPDAYTEKIIYDYASAKNLGSFGVAIFDMSTVARLDQGCLAYAWADFHSGNPTIPAFNNIDIDLSSVSTFNVDCLIYAFRGRTGINSIKIGTATSSLNGTVYMLCWAGVDKVEIGCKFIFGSAQSMCEHCTATKISFPNLEEIRNSMQYFARYTSQIVDFEMPELKTVTGANGFQYLIADSNIRILNFPKLESITGQLCNNCFSNDSLLEEINVPSLHTLNGNDYLAGNGTFANAAIGCTSLTTMKFQSLSTVGRNTMYNMFNGCTALQSLWFYALNTTSFGSYTNQFNNMLTGCTGVTVHFPIAIQSTIGSWTSVTGGFGGTNTTVLFDLVTSLTGADGNTYTRQEKDSTSTATAWVYNDTLYYTSGVSDNANGVNEPSVSDAIYSDAACQNSITTITAIA